MSSALPGISDPAVPVRLLDAYGGMAECHGSLCATADGLRLEFQTRDGFLNVFKSGVNEVTVSWSDVADLKLKRGWFACRLVLTVRSLKALEKVPGTDGCRLRMAVDRPHRSLARQLVFGANLRLCEQAIQHATQPPAGPAP